MSKTTSAGLDRAPANLAIALALVVGGTALWGDTLVRHPGALSMLPWVDGCLTVGVVGTLLALLHGIPYRTVLLYLSAPIVAVQLAGTAAAGVSFFPMLGIELTAFGLFGLPLSRLPRRREAHRSLRAVRTAP